jgi:ribosomal protein S18 acetylase RimI-like enzyme
LSLTFLIFKLHELETSALQALVAESEQEGYRFVRRLAEEYVSGKNRFSKKGEALFAVSHDGDIVGVCGLNQDPYIQEEAGRVRHLYVMRAYRKQGAARILLHEVMKMAKGHFAYMTLRTDNPAADALYRSVGFSVSEKFPETTHWLKL